MSSRYRRYRPLLGAALGFASLGVPADVRAGTVCDAKPVPCCRAWRGEIALKEAMPSFGLQIWPTGVRAETIERLAALKPTSLRFALGPTWRRQAALRADMSDAEIDRAIAAGLATRDTAREIETVRAAQRQTGAALHLVIWEPPPLPGEEQGAGTRTLQGANVPLAARFIVALLGEIAARGLILDATEITNEPDGDWNIAISPANYLALVKAIRAEATRRGITLPKIAGPGTSTIRALRRFLRDPAVARDIVDSVDLLSVHAWDNAEGADRFAELDALNDDLRRLGRRPELIVTEYGIARPDPTDNSDRMNVKRRTADSIADTGFYGSLVIRDLLRLYAGGAGAVMMWEFQDQDWGKASFGLLKEKGEQRPTYELAKRLSARLDAEKPLRFRRTDVDGLFVAQSTHFDSYWNVNISADPARVVFSDGARPAADAADQIATCAGAASAVTPPFSLNGSRIVRP